MNTGYKTYHVVLTPEQREHLSLLIKSGLLRESETKRAHVMLLADEDENGVTYSDAEIAQKLGLHPMTVHGLRVRFSKRELDRVLGISKTRMLRLTRKLMAQKLAAEGWLTVRQTSEQIGYNAEHLRLLIRNGVLKNVQTVDHRLYVLRDEIESYKQSSSRSLSS